MNCASCGSVRVTRRVWKCARWQRVPKYHPIFSTVGFTTFALSKTVFAASRGERTLQNGTLYRLPLAIYHSFELAGIFCLRVHVFMQREAPLWAAAFLWSNLCKPLWRDSRQSFFNYCIIGTIGTSLFPSLPPSLPRAVSVARSEPERGGFHSSCLISLASHYCLMIRFSCATSLIYWKIGTNCTYKNYNTTLDYLCFSNCDHLNWGWIFFPFTVL